jgi:hypothetical protein
VEAAEVFTAAEKQLKIKWDGQWIEAIQDFVDALFKEGTAVTNHEPTKPFDKLAERCIKQTLEWEELPHTLGWKNWSRVPGQPPVQYTGFYYVFVEDLEVDEDHHIKDCVTKDGVSRMHRTDIRRAALRFDTVEDARKGADEKWPRNRRKERVTIMYEDAKGDVKEIEVLRDSLTSHLNRKSK